MFRFHCTVHRCEDVRWAVVSSVFGRTRENWATGLPWVWVRTEIYEKTGEVIVSFSKRSDRREASWNTAAMSAKTKTEQISGGETAWPLTGYLLDISLVLSQRPGFVRLRARRTSAGERGGKRERTSQTRKPLSKGVHNLVRYGGRVGGFDSSPDCRGAWHHQKYGLLYDFKNQERHWMGGAAQEALKKLNLTKICIVLGFEVQWNGTGHMVRKWEAFRWKLP